MVKMIETLINGRWPLLLPEHRAARPEWPWWEATRLAAEHSVISPAAGIVDRALLDEIIQGHLDSGEWRRPVVYVAGAEEGDFPALYSTWGADVVLAEPNPRVWPNILAIWRANNLRQPLRTFQGFLVDVDSRDVHSGLSSLGAGWPMCAHGEVIGDHGFERFEERPDRTHLRIDTLVEDGCPPPDVLTVDVEGAELHVLRGAVDTIREHRPHVFVSIHEEFARHHYGIEDVHDEIAGLMKDAGYLLDGEHQRFLCRDHEEHWWWAP